MKLDKLLSQKKSTILSRWLDSILETYPSYTKRFLKKQSDQFANPVGQTLSKELEKLYQELLSGRDIDPDRVSPVLDRIVRIRAIQEFSPSQAVGGLFSLKKVVREELRKEILKHGLSDGLHAFESRIDALMLIAFDVYMVCREKIYEISANQIKNHVSGLLRRADLVCEIPEWDPSQREEI